MSDVVSFFALSHIMWKTQQVTDISILAKEEGGETLVSDHSSRRNQNAQACGPRREEDDEAQSSPRGQAPSTPGSQRAPVSRGRPSEYDVDDEETGSPSMKKEPSPQPSESELPPFHHPNLPSGHAALAAQDNRDPFASPAPKRQSGNYEIPDDDEFWDEPATTSSIPHHYKSSPASHGHFSSSVPRSQTARMEARLHRAEETPTRKQLARSGAAGNAMPPRGAYPGGRAYEVPEDDDPFIDSAPASRRDMGPGGYGGLSAQQNLGQHREAGYISTTGYHVHGQTQLTGTGYDYTNAAALNRMANRSIYERVGPAPTAEMSPSGYLHEGSHPGPVGSSRSMPPPRGIFEGDAGRRTYHAGPSSRSDQELDLGSNTRGYSSVAGHHTSMDDRSGGSGSGYDARQTDNPRYRGSRISTESGEYGDSEGTRLVGNYRGSGRIHGAGEFSWFFDDEALYGRSLLYSYMGMPLMTISNTELDEAPQTNPGSHGYLPPRPSAPHGGQAGGQPRDDNYAPASYDDHRRARQGVAEGGSGGAHAAAYEVDPDADADREEDLQEEEPEQVINIPANRPAPPPPRRQLKLDENYDDDDDEVEVAF